MKKCISPPGKRSDLAQACQVLVPHFNAAPGIVVGCFSAAERRNLGVGFVVLLLRFFRDVLPVPLEPMQCACSDLLLWVGIKVTAKVAS